MVLHWISSSTPPMTESFVFGFSCLGIFLFRLLFFGFFCFDFVFPIFSCHAFSAFPFQPKICQLLSPSPSAHHRSPLPRKSAHDGSNGWDRVPWQHLSGATLWGAPAQRSQQCNSPAVPWPSAPAETIQRQSYACWKSDLCFLHFDLHLFDLRQNPALKSLIQGERP